MSQSAAVTRAKPGDWAHSAVESDALALVRPSGDPRQTWLAAFRAVRDETERRAALLSPEDQVVQSMPDTSPTKWHRAHVTWFFEQFLLRPFLQDYQPFDERFAYLYNSYYVAAGPRAARPERGLVTRPSAAEVASYRAHVDQAVARLLESAADFGALIPIIEIGLNHEQQHQELLLTDILHAFSLNPTHPAYDPIGIGPLPSKLRATPPLPSMAFTPSAIVARAFVSTMNSRCIRLRSDRCRFRVRLSRTASGSISWPTAVTRRRRCGCRTAGL